MLIWTDGIQPQSINGNTDICCLIKYDYSGYRNPCNMQIQALYESAVTDGARVWGLIVGQGGSRHDAVCLSASDVLQTVS